MACLNLRQLPPGIDTRSLAAHLKDSLRLGAPLAFFSPFTSPEIRAQALHHQVRTSRRLKFPPLAPTSPKRQTCTPHCPLGTSPPLTLILS